ncbi:MAG: hypothetical protein ACFFAS_06225 [Promethearchaeota archaeon]
MSEQEMIVYHWQQFVEWFGTLPLLGQILLIAGAIAIVTLAVILVYYIIKGIVYLVYYLFKGIYYLLKGIGLGFYKLFKGLYYKISGKEKPQKVSKVVYVIPETVIIEKTPDTITSQQYNITFCNECGNKFTNSMKNQYNSKGQVYCVHCGNMIYSATIDIES